MDTDFPLISTTTADVTTATGCDRLEYTYSFGGSTYLRIIPAGVCLRSIIGSEMYVCDDSSTMREVSWYDSDECKGDISYSESAAESLEYYDNVSISITCCSGNQCPYVDVVVYDFDGIADCTDSDDLDINDGDVNYISSDGPFVIDSCEYTNYDSLSDRSTTYQCSDGKFIEYEYRDNLECEGTIDDTEETSTGDCYAYTSTTKIQISEIVCGTAVDTCGNYGSGAMIPAPVFILYVVYGIIGLVMFV